MNKKKVSTEKLFEYRIKYNAGAESSALDNYHYFMEKTANDALLAHRAMLKKHNLCVQDISIEKYNPYSEKWEDETNFIRGELDGECG